jgi:hypothetical protein
MGVSTTGDIQQLLVYFMENPMKMDDLGGTPISGNPQMMINV